MHLSRASTQDSIHNTVVSHVNESLDAGPRQRKVKEARSRRTAGEPGGYEPGRGRLLRLILSYSAWNRRPGSALAARYSACCKARTGSPASGDPCAAGLAETALTGPLPDNTAHRRSSGPSHHRRLCCPSGSTGTTAASDAHPADRPLPGVAGYRTPRSGGAKPQATGPGRASPVPIATIWTFRAPYAGGSLTAALPGSSPRPWPSP